MPSRVSMLVCLLMDRQARASLTRSWATEKTKVLSQGRVRKSSVEFSSGRQTPQIRHSMKLSCLWSKSTTRRFRICLRALKERKRERKRISKLEKTQSRESMSKIALKCRWLPMKKFRVRSIQALLTVRSARLIWMRPRLAPTQWAALRSRKSSLTTMERL